MSEVTLGRSRHVTAGRIASALREARLQLEQAKAAQCEPVAVIGMSCRFPGSGDTVDSFFDDLRNGRDAVREIPPNRWDLNRYYDPDPERPGRMYVRRAALLERVDEFDAAFFGISPREAASMDPQQRLLLEVSWEALENAAVAPMSLANTRTGVFLGIGQNDYSRLAAAPGREHMLGAYDGTGNGFCFAAGRISYVLGLQGPNLSVDTACSSSLVAVHLAMQSLRRRESDCALAAGVQLILSPEATLFLSRAKALSPDGCSRPFSADANGYGRGEGCGVVVLKRLADAQHAGDRILAVLRGSAVNHDGPSSGLTVPNAGAQESLLRDALNNAAIHAADVGYLEAHGTGTILGDPLEMRAVGAVFGEARPVPLRIGSVKANIGHLEAAAGIAGLIKTILILQHGEIPPALHAETLNPRIPWGELPLEVSCTATPWTAARRVAGVSSFSLSGTNAHVVLEAADPPAPLPADSSTHLLALSAKSEAALQAVKTRLVAFLEVNPGTCLADLCYTLGAGRTHHAVRWAAMVSSVSDARDALAGSSKAADLLAQRYLAGAEIPWADLYAGTPRRRLALPSYPFERQRHWLPNAPAPVCGNPLLERITRSPLLPEILFEGRLSVAAAPLLADHRILGEIVVPGAFHVSAMLGVAQSLLPEAAVELRDVIFPETLVLPEQGEVTLQALLVPDEDRSHRFTLISLTHGGWRIHAQGRVATVDAQCFTSVPEPRDSVRRDAGEMYASLERRGITLGPAFRWVAEAWSNHEAAECRMAMAAPVSAPGLPLHPGLVDSCFQLLGASENAADGDTWIPFQIGGVRLGQHAPRGEMRAVAQLRAGGGDIHLLADGRTVLEVSGLEVRKHSGRGEPLYEVAWHKLPQVETPPALEGTWLVLDDSHATGEAFAQWLRANGRNPEVVRGSVPPRHTHFQAIADFRCLDSSDPASAREGILQLVGMTRRGPARLLVFTRGAQDNAPFQSMAWGLHTALRAERRDWSSIIVDLEPGLTDASWAQILAHAANEDRLAVREGACWVPRLIPHTQSTANVVRVRQGRSYLITGGLGALGLRTAQWLLQQGATHLVLAGRHAHNHKTVDDLRAQGADVRVAACDVSSDSAVAALIASIHPPLAGVIHAAGTLEDGILETQSPEAFLRVLSPKVDGAWNLHRHTLSENLDFFICYSSVAALAASPGQGAYAVANAYLDGLMRARRAQDLPGLSIAWGPWDETGMTAESSSSSRRERWQAAGVGLLAPKGALSALGGLLGSTAGHVAVFDFRRLANGLPESEVPPILSALSVRRAAKPKTRRTDLLTLLPSSEPSKCEALLAEYLSEQVGRVLGHGGALSGDNEPLTALGVDSLMAVEIRTVVATELAKDIPIVRLLDGSGIADLAALLAEQFSSPGGDRPPEREQAAAAAASAAYNWVEGEL